LSIIVRASRAREDARTVRRWRGRRLHRVPSSAVSRTRIQVRWWFVAVPTGTDLCARRRTERLTTIRWRGWAGGCATSTRSEGMGTGTIHPRTSTGPWVSFVFVAWGVTSRGRRREVLSESRMREMCLSGSVWIRIAREH